MKSKLKQILLAVAASFSFSGVIGQNVSLNMLVLNSGVVPLNGNGSLQATVNASTGTSGQTNPIPAGKVNVQVTVPPDLLITTTQTGLPPGWTIRNNSGSVINLCNSTTTIEVNTAVDLLINLQGVSATTGAPTISGQLSFKTNCTAPGSLSGDNTSDNTSQAGFSVFGTVPVRLTHFSASLADCLPVLKWTTESEINTARFEVERSSIVNTDWQIIGTMAALNNTAEKNEYRLPDNSMTVAPGKVLYRLKMIDRNGTYKYSHVLSLSVNCKNVNASVYPNPVDNKFVYVSLTGATGQASATLLSLSGQIVLKTNINNGTSYLPLPDIARGLYILEVKDQGGNLDRKFKILIR